MANISIVNYCNLKCPYCFANDMIDNNNYTISLEELQKIIEFCKITNESIGVIGGEPTLHPNLNNILRMLMEYKLFYMNNKITIFSNGIELEKFIVNTENFYDYFSLLLNINNPKCLSNDQVNKIIMTLDKLYKDKAFQYSATVGYNLYQSDNDYIWDIVKKYNLDKLRISTVAPGKIFKEYIGKKEEFYNTMKNIFIKQCELAKQYNVILNLDCNNIPYCYFNDKELELVNQVCTHNCNLYCDDPVIDIVFGKKISACFGAYDLIDHNLFDFNNMNEVRRYLKMHRIYPKIAKNGTGKCANCEKYKLSQCQGGCLGFVTE